jgi:hypothetical protein
LIREAVESYSLPASPGNEKIESSLCPPYFCGDKRTRDLLVGFRNPSPKGGVMWTGYAGPEWGLAESQLTAIFSNELLPQHRKEGDSSE